MNGAELSLAILVETLVWSLVGTALVAKGLDVPEVTLVGVVSADIALNLPDERAAERTYQLLVQAIGRAGRGGRPGRAIIQTYLPDHPVMRRWWAHMADIMETHPDNRPVAVPLETVFHMP